MDKIRTTKSNYVKFSINLFFCLVYIHFLFGQSQDSIPLRGIDGSIQIGLLSNQLKILYLQNSNSPLASIEWALYPGTIAQKKEHEGMLALLDKFFLRPTQKDISPIQFYNRLNNLGLDSESEILTQSIHFQWIVPNKYLKEALTLLRDCWFYPKWIDLEFQREKILIARQIQQSEIIPTWFLYRDMMLKILGNENISRQTIAADYYNIQKIDLQQLKEFKNLFFCPQNTILAISGNYHFDNIMHWADSLFANWNAPNPFSLKDSLPFILKHNASAFLITSEKTNIPIVAISFPFQDSLSLKHLLMGSLIAEIFNARYSKIGKFFYNNDLGYQMVCNFRPSSLFSEFLFSIPMKREKINLAIDFIRHFPVYAFYDNWINQRDLDAAKTQLKTNFFIKNQTPWQILHELTQNYFLFNNFDYFYFLDSLESITLDELQSFFQKSINVPNPIVGFLMNSEDVIGSEIDKKLQDFWLQPFGPIYDLIDPDHVLIPIPKILPDTLIYSLIDTTLIALKNIITNLKNKANQLAEVQPNINVWETSITEKDKIYFEFNSTNIDKASLIILDKFAKYLQYNPTIKLKLTGHTDSSGPEDFNLKLSLQRANKVKNYLVQKYKIDPHRIKTEGKGEAQLAFPENTPQNRSKNRRVEAEIFVD